MGEGSGADDQRAIRDRFGEGLGFVRVWSRFRRTDRGLGFAPVRLEGSHDARRREAEVGHGARAAAPMLSGLRGETRTTSSRVALGFGEQGPIVVRPFAMQASRGLIHC